MVKMNYLGPDHNYPMLLRRTYLDLRQQSDRCRPFGPKYMEVTGLMQAVSDAYRAHTGEEIAGPGAHHSC